MKPLRQLQGLEAGASNTATTCSRLEGAERNHWKTESGGMDRWNGGKEVEEGQMKE